MAHSPSSSLAAQHPPAHLPGPHLHSTPAPGTQVRGRQRYLFDRLGIWTSALCVVHCLFTPVLLSLSAVAVHLLPGEASIHRGLSVAVALLGVVALLHGFRVHRRGSVFVAMAAGLGCIAGAAWWADRLPSHGWEVGITLLGSALMIAAHRLNHTFCRRCECTAVCHPA